MSPIQAYLGPVHKMLLLIAFCEHAHRMPFIIAFWEHVHRKLPLIAFCEHVHRMLLIIAVWEHVHRMLLLIAFCEHGLWPPPPLRSGGPRRSIVEKYVEIEYLGRPGRLEIVILCLQKYMGVRNRPPWNTTGIT